ncbi:hypothetical protein [Catelliglobosispora koreensis]|uniref:hypothetical protein n=1 Tax=Catelliglobosispora koreensis TaxID=129052 RepID=UPI000478149D|nr:hypothetical protein [Catelliglobosispora koreensis]
MRNIARVREWHRPLAINTGLMVALVLVSGIGILLDDRVLLNESVWLKPLKFGIAFALYSGVLAWLITKLRKAKRFGWWAGTVFAIAATAEVAAITAQAARGTFSHFNANVDDPFTVAMTQVFTYGVAGLFLTQLMIASLVLFQGTGDRALNRAVRWGLALATVGMMLPIYWMSTNINERVLVDANGTRVTMYQGHGIGDPDGNGMALTHWSTTGGDFRVPHFVGLHGIHVLLLLTVALVALSHRLVWLTSVVRSRLMLVFALAYSGLLAVITWQAGRGQSLIHPDRMTLLAFAGVVAFALVASAGVVIVAKRRVQPSLAMS